MVTPATPRRHTALGEQLLRVGEHPLAVARRVGALPHHFHLKRTAVPLSCPAAAGRHATCWIFLI